MDDQVALQSWGAQQFASGGALGHEARRKRAGTMLAAMAAHPGGSVPAVFTVEKERTAAFRFLESTRFDWRDVAEPIHFATAEACRGESIVVVPCDGSSFRHSDHDGDDGVGRIGSRGDALGIKSFIALACTLRGEPLGVLAHEFWARDAEPNAVPHTRRALEDKESRFWTEMQARCEQALRDRGVACRPWYQCDREGDCTHVLLRAAEQRVLLTVRAKSDRLLDAIDPIARTPKGKRKRTKLRAAIEGAPAQGAMHVEISAGPKRAARLARFEVSFADVSLKLRSLWSHRALPSVAITAVRVRETSPCPSGERPIEWLLLTTYPVHSIEDAMCVVRAYGLRWLIERLHFTWKTGSCHVEDSQKESFDVLAKWATLQLAVAAHRQRILHLSRTQPALPADEVFDRDEIDGALALYQRHSAKAPPLGATPTLGALVEIISRLGGYVGKSSGGPPGIKVFSRGMDAVAIAADVLRAQRKLTPPQSSD